MEERIVKVIQALTVHRDVALKRYVESLESYDGHRAADYAGELHDLDRHINNLEMEIKRTEALAHV